MAEDVSVGNLVTNLVGDGEVFLKNIEAAINRIDALNVRVQSVGASIANVNRTTAPAQPMQQQVGAVANIATHQLVAATASANAAKSAAVQLTQEQRINQAVERRIDLLTAQEEINKQLEERGFKKPKEDVMEEHIPARLIAHIVSHGAEEAGMGGIGGQTMLFSHLLEHGLPLAGGVVVALALAAAIHHVYEEHFRLNEAAIAYVDELKKAEIAAKVAGQAVLGNTDSGKAAANAAAEHAQKAEDIAEEYAKARREAGATEAAMDDLNRAATAAHNAIWGTQGPALRDEEDEQIKRKIQDQKELANLEQSFAQTGFEHHEHQETGDMKGQVEAARIEAMRNGPVKERLALEHKINEEKRGLGYKQMDENEAQMKAQAEELLAAKQRGAGKPEISNIEVRQINERNELDKQQLQQRNSLAQKAAEERIGQEVKEQDAIISHENSFQQARIDAETTGLGKQIAMIHERLSEALAAAQREGQGWYTVMLIKQEAAEKEKALYASVKDSIEEQNVSLDLAQHKITEYAAALQKIAIQNQGASKDMIDLLEQQAAVQEKVWGANFARQQLESIHNLRGMNMQLEDYKRDLDRAVESGQLQVDQAKELYKQKQWEIGLTKPIEAGRFQSSGGPAGRMANIDYRYLNQMFTPQAYKEYSAPGAAGGRAAAVQHMAGQLRHVLGPGGQASATLGTTAIGKQVLSKLGSEPSMPSKDPNTDILSSMLKLWERYLAKEPLN